MSRTLQNTIDWVSPIIRFMPLNIGANNEPAITNANIVQQTIVGPPFCWNWNRAVKTFQTVVGQQDYTVAVTSFGFVEKAALTDSNNVIKEIPVKECLSPDSTQGRPDYLSAQSDDGAGNITFRLLKVPNAVYTVTVTYQKEAPLFSALAGTWTVPDDYAFICDYGFLTLALLHLDDPRIQIYNQKFMSALLGTNRGLSDMDRNIFIGNWLALTRQEMNESIKTQQGNTARGV